ncbi:MAG: histidine phosphatase family protein [Gammaproteobacteria bacterium]|nr:histidine phosphatase family protein [Gammaproteobacteria bacterium]MBU1722612.1 histidine phosphatase family protein [Gammaproteobacteria bacterium]MBU2007084.1 histidine phosphatase family protein [Gammaproteobacteria bacterium]
MTETQDQDNKKQQPDTPETSGEMLPETPPVSTPTTVDLLRHGQVATPNLFCAPANEPLGINGWKQLTRATQPGQWDAVITSPSRRCHDFARMLSQRLDCPFEVDARFGELDFGTWIGKTQEAIWEEAPELMQQLWLQPRRFIAPQGEAMDNFINRIQVAWDELQTCYAGKHVLLLTHAGVIRVVLARVLDILYQKSLKFEVGYAQITRVRTYPDGATSLLGHGLPHA